MTQQKAMNAEIEFAVTTNDDVLLVDVCGTVAVFFLFLPFILADVLMFGGGCKTE